MSLRDSLQRIRLEEQLRETRKTMDTRIERAVALVRAIEDKRGQLQKAVNIASKAGLGMEVRMSIMPMQAAGCTEPTPHLHIDVLMPVLSDSAVARQLEDRQAEREKKAATMPGSDAAHLGLLDDADHEAKMAADAIAEDEGRVLKYRGIGED